MTLDLREELERATSGLRPDVDVVARGRSTGRRRLIIRNTRNVVGGVAAVALVGAAVGNLPTQGERDGAGTRAAASGSSSANAPATASTAPAPSPTVVISPTVNAGAKPPIALTRVFLPDPAPGFPVRSERDEIGRTMDATRTEYWARVYSVAKSAPREVPAGGDMTGNDLVPTGPQVTIIVSQTAVHQVSADGTLDGNPVVGEPTVAGVTGVLTRYVDSGDGSVWWQLQFAKGRFAVVMTASEKVTLDELVALAESLTGLDG